MLKFLVIIALLASTINGITFGLMNGLRTGVLFGAETVFLFFTGFWLIALVCEHTGRTIRRQLDEFIDKNYKN